MGFIGEAGGIEQGQYGPDEYITGGELNSLMDRICAYMENQEEWKDSELYDSLQKSLGEDIREWEDGKLLTRELWRKILDVMIEKLAADRIKEQTLFILDKKSSDSGEKLVTDKGDYYYEGFDSGKYKMQSITALVRDNTILILEPADGETILHNVWIEQGEGLKLDVFLNGTRMSMSLEDPLSEDMERVVGDISLSSGKVVKIQIKPEIITGKVLASDQDSITLETEDGETVYPLDTEFKIYRVYDETASEPARGILVGYKNTEFVVADRMICAALINSSLKAENIRVLIKNDGFQDIYHDTVKVTSDTDFTVTYGKTVKECSAGKTVTITTDSKMVSKNRVLIRSKEKDGKIKLLSVKRNSGNPEYRGVMEISLYDNKQLIIVNELPFEEYLYGVVPSEMPSGYGVEALKVQAVCARSYAYNQLLSNSCSQYGAHVDDSVSYQVYNNMPENEETIIAVKETHGQVLRYGDSVITAYYFSTSCGHTSSADEVWISTKKVPYLEGAWQTKTGLPKNRTDLSGEEAFREFINEKPDDTYDSSYSWFRWNVEISADALKESVDNAVSQRYKANPNLVLTKNEAGEYESCPVDSIGAVRNITVSSRQTGGIATQAIIEGSEKTIKVISEYNIRTLLAPLNDVIVRQDGSRVNGLSMLPSAFFAVDKKTEDDQQIFVFNGGGYGHGVGMSQNGAKAMADEGCGYEDILKHYYQGIEIGYIYE